MNATIAASSLRGTVTSSRIVVGLRRASAENAFRRAAASASAFGLVARGAHFAGAVLRGRSSAIRSLSSATAAGWPSVSISSTASQSVGRPTWA